MTNAAQSSPNCLSAPVKWSGRDAVNRNLITSLLVAAGLLITTLLAVALLKGPQALLQAPDGAGMHILYALAYLVLVAGGLAGATQMKVGVMIRNAVIWLAIFTGFGLIYLILNP